MNEGFVGPALNSDVETRTGSTAYRALPWHRNFGGIEEIRPERIMELGLGFWSSRALLSAVELGLFSELAAGPLDAQALQQRLGLHERGARDFFDALVALGMLGREGGLYFNEPDTDFYLDRGKPSYIGGLLERCATRLYPTWGALTEALKTGKPQNGVKDGEDFFDFQYADAESVEQFARAMTGASIPAARSLARQFPWANCETFIDIGCAQGAAAVEIGRAHAHLSGGGFDLPQVRPVFEAYVRRQGLDPRLRFYAGDFLKEPLPSAQVLVMGHILHDWNLEVKRELLAKAHEALPRGGVLIAYDRMIDDDRRRNAGGLLMSLNMLVSTRGGFDYTAADCSEWMRAAGFHDVNARHLGGPYAMVAAVK